MNSGEKLGKKDRKKLKAKEKLEEAQNDEFKKEDKLARVEVKFEPVPLIITGGKNEGEEMEKLRIKTKNKKLDIL